MAGTAEGARTFAAGGDDYDRWMGRYSRALAGPFAAAVTLAPHAAVLDVGCGPGALTAELVRLVGAERVRAIDPSPAFAQACASRHPGVEVLVAGAEEIPFADGSFDAVYAQLVLSFLSDPLAAMAEFRRVLRPGGAVAACVWDFTGGMQMLRAFWDAALALDPAAPDEATTTRFGSPGEIARLFEDGGLDDVVETTIEVWSDYRDFDEFWSTVLLGIGPAGAYAASLPPERQEVLRGLLLERVGAPTGAFRLRAAALTGVGRAPV